MLYRISDKGWSSSSDIGQRATAAHRKYHPVPKCNSMWTEFVSPRLGASTGCLDHVKESSGSIRHGNLFTIRAAVFRGHGARLRNASRPDNSDTV